MQQQLQKTLTSPADAAGFLQGSRDSGGSSKDSSCDTDDFVMVPAQFPGQGVTRRGGQGERRGSHMCLEDGLLEASTPRLSHRVRAQPRCGLWVGRGP